jgi:hypothetical protein
MTARGLADRHVSPLSPAWQNVIAVEKSSSQGVQKSLARDSDARARSSGKKGQDLSSFRAQPLVGAMEFDE